MMKRWEEDDKFVIRYDILTKENAEKKYSRDIENFSPLNKNEEKEVDLNEIKEYGLYYTACDWSTYIICLKRVLKKRG